MLRNCRTTINSLFPLFLGIVSLCLPMTAFPGLQADPGLTEAEQIWLENHKTIPIGIMNAWPPMDYVDENGQPRGIGTRFIHALNERLGDRLVIVPGRWQEIYEAAKDKRLDALMDITPRLDREEFFHFTRPYIDVPHMIFTRKYDPYKGGLSELIGRKVAVVKGFFLVKMLHDNYPQIILQQFDTDSDAIRALADGEVDAYVGNRVVSMYIIENDRITNIAPAGKIAESSSANAIGVRKDWPILRDILQKALDDIAPDERANIINPPDLLERQDIQAKRFLSKLSESDRDWLNEHKPFYIAVMDGWPPFNYVDENGTSSGIGIDFLNALNTRLGNILKPMPGEWERIFEDVKEKRLDVIMDITPNPEREPFFNFTTPYIQVPHVIVARKDSVFLESERSLEGKTLALEQGFGNEKYFREHYPAVKLKMYANTLLALDAVSRGDAHAYAGNRVVALYLIDKYYISNLRVHGSLHKPASTLALGVRKDYPRLREILQRALDDVGTDERREIIDHWVRTSESDNARQQEIRLTYDELKWLDEHGVIPVEVDGDWPPIDFINAEGNHVGIIADYLNLIGQRLGIKFIAKRSPRFQEMLQKVVKGEINVTASMPLHSKYAGELYFSKPYYQSRQTIIIRDNAAWVGGITDLNGRRIAVEDGSATMLLLQTEYPKIRLRPVSSTLEALQMVSNGTADAYVGNQAVVGWLLKRNQLKNLHISGNSGLGDGLLSFAVPKDAAEWKPLIGIIDKVLATVSEHEQQRIEQNWLGRDDVEGIIPRVDLNSEEKRWLQEHKSIRLGVDSDWAPVEFIDSNGEYKGLSSEYMRIFAAQLGINWIKPQKKSWADVQKGLNDKSLDVAPVISSTPERDSYLSFTKPYLDFTYVIFNRRGTMQLKGLSDLNGKKVAAIEGYSITDSLRQDYPLIEYSLYKNAQQAMQAVSVGEADAFVGSLVVGGYLIGQEGLSNLQVAATTNYSRKYSVGVRKDWPELVGILNKAIDTLDDPLKNDIFRRWSTVIYEQHVDYTLVWQILGIALLTLSVSSVWIMQIRHSRQIIQKGRERLELTLKSAELGAWEARVNSKGYTELLSLDETFCQHHGMREVVDHISLNELYGYIDPENHASMRKSIREFLLMRAKDNISFEYRIKGEDRWLYSKGHTLEWDESGRPRYVVGITQDITERHKAHEALQQASRFKGEFLANMSHEIRTPMNAIIGLGQLIAKTQLSPKQTDYVHKIQVSAKSLLGVIDDILDFSKIEAGRLVIETIPFSFEDIFESISILAATRIGDSPIEFLYDFDMDIPPNLEGDPYRIGQILTNLVSNAVKFTKIGSIVVRIRIKERDSGTILLRFEVEDTGIGIDPGKLEFLFSPFTQADGSTTRQYGGTGLGLSICQKLCELMGGSIGAESRLGKGSLFYFELPLRYYAAQARKITHRELQNLKVLLVDDNLTVQTVIKDMLESMSFIVTVAGSGIEALQQLTMPESHFDIILLDWKMPHIDGFETVRRINNIFHDERPIIIMMTAYGREIMEQGMNEASLDGILIKPLTPSILFDAIIRAYDSKSSETPSQILVDEPSFSIVKLQGKVLLVEDNEINQLVGKELLEQMGLQVDCVENGQQAVKYIEQHRPDLVLMDIQMPVMDGYEATRYIRERLGMQDLPIFAMTANAIVGDAEKSLQVGMDGHISKPIDSDELYRILSEKLNSASCDQQTELLDQNTQKPHWTPPAENPPNIDYLQGLRQVGGNPDFYFKLLGDFLSKHQASVNEIEEMIKASNYKDARRAAHTLKGVAGNIGAYDLQNVAADLEACLANDKSPQAELFNKFASTCNSLLATIQDVISASAWPEPISESPAIEDFDFEDNLEILLSELKSGNAESTALYMKLKPVLNKRLNPNQFAEVNSMIMDFDFEEAAELLELSLNRKDPGRRESQTYAASRFLP